MKYNIHKYSVNSRNEVKLYKVKETDTTSKIIDHLIK